MILSFVFIGTRGGHSSCIINKSAVEIVSFQFWTDLMNIVTSEFVRLTFFHTLTFQCRFIILTIQNVFDPWLKLCKTKIMEPKMTEQEYLVAMSDELKQRYLDLLQRKLPHTLRPYLFLLLQTRWKSYSKKRLESITQRCIYNIYVPRDGRLVNCTFIALSGEADSSDQTVCIPKQLSSKRDSFNDRFNFHSVAKSLRFFVFAWRRRKWTLSLFSIFAPHQVELFAIDRINWNDACNSLLSCY